MAKKSKIAQSLKYADHSTKAHHRCALCGRPRAYMRMFGICRLCFRELAHKGELPGVVKSSF